MNLYIKRSREMSKEYSPKEIEKKWQDIWDNEKAVYTRYIAEFKPQD